MGDIKFVDILKHFENEVDGRCYEDSEKEYDDKKTIENDVERTIFLGVDEKNTRKILILKRILFKVLCDIPNSYMQGMSEIGAVFVLHYLEDAVDEYIRNDKDASDDADVQVDERSRVHPRESFISVPEGEKEIFFEFVSNHEEVLKKLKAVLTNVFKEKFEPLIENDFRMYKESMRVSMEMMMRRGVRVSELESYRFMGSVLTFFSRNLSRRIDVCRMFGVILSSSNTCPFLILTHFCNEVSKSGKIDAVDDDLLEKMVLLEREFIETERNMTAGKFFTKPVFLVAAAGIIVAILVYRVSKKE